MNEKLEGSWQVTYYNFYDPPTPDYIKNGIAFKSKGENKGTIWWAEHRELNDTKDTVTGFYTIDENSSSMQINWQDTHLYGITKSKTLGVGLSQDNLTLTWPDTFNHILIYTDTARAVRN